MGFRSFKSPIPYLFGGLALMLLLIAIALFVLACSHRKRQSSDDEEKSGATKTTPSVESSEPKILVIMAGDTNPSYLANPISCSK
ncbi:Protein GLUTAMINE DUMPER 2 [Senna tora]|uniref:Protein GLUTAMINE DUMPER 2 n=1 Tax=Senna tora TaxID=362788 RepID=A0A834TR99_9FABA|nr:Protein GLUTAMINE DUMPER 2 [Senna tora]